MDLFSPRQFVDWHKQLVIPATRWHTEIRIHASKVQDSPGVSTESVVSPVYDCFKVITVLNLPPLLAARWLMNRALSTALKDSSGWLKYRIPGESRIERSKRLFKDTRLQELVTNRFKDLAEPWLDRFAFNALDNFRKPWTLITYSFIHLDVIHYLANMAGLWSLAPACARIPNLDLKHICAIVIGSSISGAIGNWLQTLLCGPRDTPAKLSYATGASAIVSGFMAVVAVAEPRSWTTIGFWIMELRTKAWFVAAMTFTLDIVGILGQLVTSTKTVSDLAVKTNSGRTIGHSAHLMGMLFGFTYYHLFLKRSRTLEGSGRMPLDRRNASRERSRT